MNHPVIDTWIGDEQELDLSCLDAGHWEKMPRAVMGWKGLKIWDKSVDPVDMLAAYLSKASEESCGQCTPCRLGTARMATLAQGLSKGEGKAGDLDQIRHLVRQIGHTARCDLGRTLAKPVLDLMDQFRNEFTAAVRGKRRIQKSATYAATLTAPCIQACPAHVDIPAYLENVRMGQWSKAMDTVRQGCPMPGTIGRVCVRPCESACRRGELDAPLSVRAVKRFLGDLEMGGELAPLSSDSNTRPEKVAVVGAGPAGLSCAYYLGKQGIKATVFEAQEGPGGMAAYGIPSYRLPRDVIAHEVRMVESVGAEIRYNTAIGKNISLEELTTQGYKAVFVGAGAPAPAKMRCDGEDEGYENFIPGVEFLARAARGETPLSGRRVAVIGGGNVAMDCVRTSRRLGFSNINLIYRRTEAQMPADPHEIREAREEGVKFHFLVAPVRIVADDQHRVTGLECMKMILGEPDSSGRRRPVPVENSQFIMECDAIIPAIGQTCTLDNFLPKEDGVLSRWNTLEVDSITGQSPIPHIFGGGDCATGPSTLIAALAAGKKGALAIAGYLETGTCPDENDEMVRILTHAPTLFQSETTFSYPGCTQRAEAPILPPEIRVENFDEVEKGFAPFQARIEAARCLRCYRMVMAAF
ncbi:MAG: FAD-dependent oxidoreductase [Desulfobacter sp.]|nr:MAG: FAD-dependent oxidoreductase [Desulfobacter sp.]